MSHSPQAEPAPTRRSSRSSSALAPAPVDDAAALTRAELRRRAEAAPSEPVTEEPLTRRATRARFVVAAVVADEPGAAVDAAPDASSAALGADAREAETREDVAVEDVAPEDVAVEQLADLTPEALIVPGPGAEDEVADGSPAAGAADDRIVDEFEAAKRLFSFTGETPVQVAATALADTTDIAVPASAPRRRRVSFKRVATASFSIGVVGAVGLLTVGMTTPLEAVAAANSTTAVSAAPVTAGDVAATDEDIQAYVAPAEVQNAAVERSDAFEAASLADIAAESGISNFSNFFTNDPKAAIQWPFAVGVPITYGFGMRSGTMHEGVDFVPGAGSPVQAIADGTVRLATESGGAFGVTVLIDHVIDGELVSSRYAHMEYGSLQVVAGQKVTVGTFIGRTGNTGRSFGAHTHFELLAGGTTAIDPLPWLREHAGG